MFIVLPHAICGTRVSDDDDDDDAGGSSRNRTYALYRTYVVGPWAVGPRDRGDRLASPDFGHVAYALTATTPTTHHTCTIHAFRTHLAAYLAALAVNLGRSSPRSNLRKRRNDSIEEAPLAFPARLAPFFRSAYVNNDKVQLYCLCQCSTAIRWCKCNQSCNISLHDRSVGIRIQDSGLYWPFMRGTRRRRKRKRHNAKITRTRKITASRRNALFGMLWGWRHRMLGVEGWNG